MKTDYKPNYAVSPVETIAEYYLYQVFGKELIANFEEGITEKNVCFLTAIFPTIPKQFWLNLQKNYDETIKRLSEEKSKKGDT